MNKIRYKIIKKFKLFNLDMYEAYDLDNNCKVSINYYDYDKFKRKGIISDDFKILNLTDSNKNYNNIFNVLDIFFDSKTNKIKNFYMKRVELKDILFFKFSLDSKNMLDLKDNEENGLFVLNNDDLILYTTSDVIEISFEFLQALMDYINYASYEKTKLNFRGIFFKDLIYLNGVFGRLTADTLDLSDSFYEYSKFFVTMFSGSNIRKLLLPNYKFYADKYVGMFSDYIGDEVDLSGLIFKDIGKYDIENMFLHAKIKHLTINGDFFNIKDVFDITNLDDSIEINEV